MRRLITRNSVARRPLPVCSSRIVIAPFAQRRRLLSTKPVPAGSAYDVLGVGRDIDTASLRVVYKQLAQQWHPDRHQGDGKADAEKKFQEISEAFQTLEDEGKRQMYDEQLDAAKTASEQKAAAQRFRAASWNTDIPDMKVSAFAARDRLARTHARSVHVLVIASRTHPFLAL